MPAPIAIVPLAVKAAAAAAAAGAVYAAVRRARVGEARPMRMEEALDETPEGLDLSYGRDADRARADVQGRWVRSVRLGTHGPGVEVDLTALTRFRVRKLDPL